MKELFFSRSGVVLLAAFVAVICTFVVWCNGSEEDDEFLAGGVGTNGVLFNELVNQTEQQIRREHGAPAQIWEEYRPLENTTIEIPEGRIKTLLFSSTGGLNGFEGTLIVWFVERSRGWVCFASVWFASNAWFQN